MSNWRFTGLEFDILWTAFGHDRLPYPLRFRPVAEDFEDLRSQREAAVAVLLDKYYSPELVRVLDLLREPEVRVELKGFGNTDMARTYRFHGAISGTAGATLVQLPGVDDDTGGDVIVANCSAGQVPAQAVSALPPVAAGKHGPLEVRREEISADRERYVRNYHEDSLVQRLDRIFKRPRHSMGEIRIFPGPAVDARPAFSRGFWWMDYDDGRYYVRTGDPIVAKPISARAMAAEITRLAGLTQRFYREDREHDDYLRTRR
ncbi:ESX secretion-associated protein EspG [Nocardia donostiensis]|uniref:ESX secretion-associated protein EspG n=1 Tax=Nocardia donostiensis TaxID=1538463 RepID=A0A1W0BKK9_9NOCA|nr:ESX secretion-associated protein EspG [Nocardia donostiensis]ONM48889.1 ESX secretion-associated protein EspG [Nocardia donostiensis]OQS22856.1 ESX secretion-associated protein EspG [Nocardia donostiensis]